MAGVTVQVEVRVYCKLCGMGLCGFVETGITERRSIPYIRVMPCPNCTVLKVKE